MFFKELLHYFVINLQMLYSVHRVGVKFMQSPWLSPPLASLGMVPGPPTLHDRRLGRLPRQLRALRIPNDGSWSALIRSEPAVAVRAQTPGCARPHRARPHDGLPISRAAISALSVPRSVRAAIKLANFTQPHVFLLPLTCPDRNF